MHRYLVGITLTDRCAEVSADATCVRALVPACLWLLCFWPYAPSPWRAQWRQRELDSKLNMLGNVYGAHVPMRKRMDMRIVSACQRMPGLPSSNLGLEILLNKHEDLDFDDFLADPTFATEQIDVHLAMEKRLGLDRPIGKPIRTMQRGADALIANRAAISEA